MKKLKNILLTDIKQINKYFLVVLALVIITSFGATSYALFSYEVISPNNIKIGYNDINGPTCTFDTLEKNKININSKASLVMNCTDSLGVKNNTLKFNDFNINGDIEITNIEQEEIINGYKYVIEITSKDIETTANISLKEKVLEDGLGNYNKESIKSNDIIVEEVKTYNIVIKNMVEPSIDFYAVVNASGQEIREDTTISLMEGEFIYIYSYKDGGSNIKLNDEVVAESKTSMAEYYYYPTKDATITNVSSGNVLITTES